MEHCCGAAAQLGGVTVTGLHAVRQGEAQTERASLDSYMYSKTAFQGTQILKATVKTLFKYICIATIKALTLSLKKKL